MKKSQMPSMAGITIKMDSYKHNIQQVFERVNPKRNKGDTCSKVNIDIDALVKGTELK